MVRQMSHSSLGSSLCLENGGDNRTYKDVCGFTNGCLKAQVQGWLQTLDPLFSWGQWLWYLLTRTRAVVLGGAGWGDPQDRDR